MSRYDEPDGGDWKAPRRRWRPVGGRRASVWMLVTGWLATVLVAVLVIAALGAYVKYRTVWDSIKRVDVTSLGKQPPKYNNAENILLLGSDTRTGTNARIGGHIGCNCSDTLLLLHISPGHHRVTVISVPRDTEVPTLGCPADQQVGAVGQQAAPGQDEPINYTLSYGGPVCTWKTLDYVTRIHIDHFIQLDFVGFQKVVDDIGGVNVCLPFAVHDPKSGLNLRAGRHHVYGREALAFWRTRENIGYGSDTQRIQRDQLLMASLVQGIEHSGLLSSPTKILTVVKDAANAMTTDQGLDQSTMLQIATSLRGLSSQSVRFLTAPNVPYPPNPNKVELEQPQAGGLFHALAHDTKLPKVRKTRKSRHSTATTPVLDTAPSKVNVSVLNGAGISGLAGQAGSDLSSRGFNVVNTGDAGTTGYTHPVIEYAAATDLPAVNTLKAQLTGATVRRDASLTPGTIDLIVGSSFTGLAAKSAQASDPSVSALSPAYGGITGSANICKDTAAFAGPLSPSGG